MISVENDILKKIDKCFLAQIILKTYLEGIVKYPNFFKFFSQEEASYIDIYKKEIRGELNNLLNRLSCNLDSYSSFEEIKKDLEHLQKRQLLITHFLSYAVEKMRKEMNVWERIGFFFFNLKQIFPIKDEEKNVEIR